MQSAKSASKAPVAIWPDGPPRPLAPYTPAIKAAGWLFISGQLASDFKNGLAPEARSSNSEHGQRARTAVRYTLKNLANTATSGRLRHRQDAVRIWQWFTSPYPTMEEFKAGQHVAADLHHAVPRHAQRVHQGSTPRLDRHGHP